MKALLSFLVVMLMLAGAVSSAFAQPASRDTLPRNVAADCNHPLKVGEEAVSKYKKE